ncbi:hypothetical protein [Streptomyces werraensis]|uniref:hypothetical protein n=1 Tax=Streptomyces werraensis TaxID=68284 RepID=UPI00382332EF
MTAERVPSGGRDVANNLDSPLTTTPQLRKDAAHEWERIDTGHRYLTTLLEGMRPVPPRT